VLPWDGETTEFKTLDPSCGSGIFLLYIKSIIPQSDK